MNAIKTLKLALAALLLGTLAACGGGGGGEGTLRLSLTDAPTTDFKQVNVTVEKIRVHQSSTASDSDGGWYEIPLTDTEGNPIPPQRFDLLTLQNGVLAGLGQARLPAGTYTQLRLVLAANSEADPWANSVVLNDVDSTEVALTTPSGQQSGLKLKTNITVLADQVADFVIDIDAHKSIQVVGAGASGKYLLRPVIRVMPRYYSSVAGFLDPDLAVICDQCVSLQKDGVVVQHTTPAEDGRFVLWAEAGEGYALVVTVPEHATAVVTGVPVVAGHVTEVNTSENAINPPLSDSGTLDGAVTIPVAGPSTDPATGTMVRVLQHLTASPTTIEVASDWVDATAATYSYLVPVGATQVAPYVVPASALAFLPDTDAAGMYSLLAHLDGFVDLTPDLAQLTSGATITTVLDLVAVP